MQFENQFVARRDVRGEVAISPFNASDVLIRAKNWSQRIRRRQILARNRRHLGPSYRRVALER